MRGKGIGLVASGMIAGIFIGSHMVGAIGASAPCGTATPVVKATGHAILAVYDGDTVHTKPDMYNSYHTVKRFTYRGPVTITMTGTQIDPKKNADGAPYVQADVTMATGLGGDVAIAPGDPRTQTTKKTVSESESQCKFGCIVGIVNPQNIRWHIVVTK